MDRRWSYYVLPVPHSPMDLPAALARMGADGWELIVALSDGNPFPAKLVFKRPQNWEADNA